MAKKLRIFGVKNLEPDVLTIELKREKGLMGAINSLLEKFGIFDLEKMLVNENDERKKNVGYDYLFKSKWFSKHNYFSCKTFNLHFITFPKSVMLIFYLKRKDARNKVINKIDKYFVFTKQKVKKK